MKARRTPYLEPVPVLSVPPKWVGITEIVGLDTIEYIVSAISKRSRYRHTAWIHTCGYGHFSDRGNHDGTKAFFLRFCCL